MKKGKGSRAKEVKLRLGRCEDTLYSERREIGRIISMFVK